VGLARPKLEQADWLVFDLDPAKGKGIEQAIEAAIVMRGLLEHLELPSAPKTSGKRGIHVFVPHRAGLHARTGGRVRVQHRRGGDARGTDHDRRALARQTPRPPSTSTACRTHMGRTIVAPYSPRGIDGAPVSAPLKWEEVTKKLDPLKYNIRTIAGPLRKVGDLFEPVLKKGAKLPDLA